MITYKKSECKKRNSKGEEKRDPLSPILVKREGRGEKGRIIITRVEELRLTGRKKKGGGGA